MYGALVGALFLSVLLVITVWSTDRSLGALIVCAPARAVLAVRPLAARLPAREAAARRGDAALRAASSSLALLPRISDALVALALAFCGAGLGLAVPAFTGRRSTPKGGRRGAA